MSSNVFYIKDDALQGQEDFINARLVHALGDAVVELDDR
jgi:hypothetical protein